jgi:hypothetical protein
MEQLAMLGQLIKLDLGHVHESVDFIFGALEVFNAKGVDGDNLDSGLVAHLEYLPLGVSARVNCASISDLDIHERGLRSLGDDLLPSQYDECGHSVGCHP